MSTSAFIAADLNGRPAGSKGVFWAVVTACLAVSSVAFGSQLSPNFLYGIDDAAALWEIDIDSQTAQNIGQTSLTGLPNALALDNRGNLFAVDGSNNLWVMNGSNLSGVQILAAGSLGMPVDLDSQPRSAAIYDDAYWFFVGGGENGATGSTELRKLKIDYTGATPQVISVTAYETPVGTPNAFGDIAITPAGKLYAYTSGDTRRFYSLDLTNIVDDVVGGYAPIASAPTVVNTVQIAFRPNGTLYGSEWDTGNWYTVNTTTGQLTPVGTFQTLAADGKSFRDIGGSSVQAVPEPATFGMAAISFAALAWQTTSRRRSAVRPMTVRGPRRLAA